MYFNFPTSCLFFPLRHWPNTTDRTLRAYSTRSTPGSYESSSRAASGCTREMKKERCIAKYKATLGKKSSQLPHTTFAHYFNMCHISCDLAFVLPTTVRMEPVQCPWAGQRKGLCASQEVCLKKTNKLRQPK